MIDQPKPTTGEWTAEALARQFHELYESYACEFAYETRQETRAFNPTTPNGRLMIAVCKEIANAHNAALAAEREKHERTLAILDKATEQLRSQLAAAQAAIQRHKRAYGHTLDFPDDTTALDAAITEAYDHARKEADRDWTDVLEAKIAAAQQPLVDALKFYADQENYVNDVLGLSDGSSEVEGSSEINQDGGMKASDALANVKETKCHK